MDAGLWVKVDRPRARRGRLVRVTVDVPRLRANLSAEVGHEMSCCETRQLLEDRGFLEDGDHWLAREPDLRHLRPDEVTSIEPADDAE